MIRVRTIIFLVVTGVLILMYSLTLSPTVEFIDSGELALACKNLGIAHPTGYPLYTILGRISAMLLWGSLIFRVNVLSLLLTSFGAGFLALSALELISDQRHDVRWKNLIAGSTALFAGLTPVWWAQGTTNEVYALNLLLITGSVYFFIGYLKGAGQPIRKLILSGYALGLSLANHLSAIYIVPGFLIVLIIRTFSRRLRKRNLAWFGLFLLSPLTLYLFLPIRARFAPFLNWGGVDDLYFLYKHITGWQYRIWMFSDASFGVVFGRVVHCGELMLRQFGLIGLVLAVIGFVRLAIKARQFWIFAVVAGLLNVIYAVNYQIADIDSYYLPLIILISLFMASAIDLICRPATGPKKNKIAVAVGLALLLTFLPAYNLARNYRVSDRSERTFARQGVYDIVKSMQPGSCAVVENWDFYSPWLYLNFAEDFHKDIVLLDKELLRRSWYIDFVRRTYPDLYGRSADRIEDFVREVGPFERGKPFNPSVIDSAYYGMLEAIMEDESQIRTVYTNVAGDPKFIRLLPLVPDGILFRQDRSLEFLKRPLYEFDEIYWRKGLGYGGARVANLLTYYSRAFAARESYCRHFGRIEEAEYYKKLAARTSLIISEMRR